MMGERMQGESFYDWMAEQEDGDPNAPVVLTEPMLANYNIPESFDFGAFDDLSEKFYKESEYRKKFLVAIAVAIVASAVAGIVYFGGFLDIYFFPPILISPVPISIFLYAYMKEKFLPAKTGILVLSDKVRDYRMDTARWRRGNFEARIAYWLPLRGVQFELAVAGLLRKRGCLVETTKATGDGGIDLRVTLNKKTYFCQCKGHAKPISVAPVREIAGVSRARGAYATHQCPSCLASYNIFDRSKAATSRSLVALVGSLRVDGIATAASASTSPATTIMIF